MFKLINRIGNKDFESLAKEFYPHAKQSLQFDIDPVVILAADSDNAINPLGKTAYYEPDNNCVVIFGSKRHTKDMLRSFSHELVHHAQNCRGEFNDSTVTEDGYAQNDENLRKMEEEAYLKGNMIFRDWEDGYKQEKSRMSENKIKRALDAEYDVEAISHKRSVSREKFHERMGIKFDLNKLKNINEDIEGETQEDEVDNLEAGNLDPLTENDEDEEFNSLNESNCQSNCEKRLTCCDCGGKGCGCSGCWNCNACEACLSSQDNSQINESQIKHPTEVDEVEALSSRREIVRNEVVKRMGYKYDLSKLKG